MNLPAEEFLLLRDLVYERTGLMFEEKKSAFVAARVGRRAAAVGCSSARDYYRHLRYEDGQGKEFQAFVEQMTTNETYFFRDYPQLECFANEALPRAAEAKRRAGDYTLSVWSAACSTGDEAYTLAIILDACLDDVARWKIRLFASDIDTEVLAVARAGVYGERNLKDVPGVYRDKYFTHGPGGYRVIDRVRNMVAFEQLNFMDRDGMRRQRGFDFVLCRNALIYFDDASRRQVLGHFYDALVPGGFVFLGHSESVGRISSAFEPVSLGGGVVYRRPPGRRADAPGAR